MGSMCHWTMHYSIANDKVYVFRTALKVQFYIVCMCLAMSRELASVNLINILFLNNLYKLKGLCTVINVSATGWTDPTPASKI